MALRPSGHTDEALMLLTRRSVVTSPCWIQPGFRSPCAMLVIPLARRDKGQRRNFASRQVRIQATRAVEANDVLQTVVPLRSLLDVLEISERIVLHGVCLHDARRGQGR